MNLLSRIYRLEQKRGTSDPFASLTDEELEQAMAKVTEAIEQATGMSVMEYAEKLEREGGDSDLDPGLVSAFISAMKKDFKQAYDQVGSVSV